MGCGAELIREIVEGVGELDADLGLGVAVQVAPLVAHVEDDVVAVGDDFGSFAGFVDGGGHADFRLVAEDEAGPAFVASGSEIAGGGGGLICDGSAVGGDGVGAGAASDEEDLDTEGAGVIEETEGAGDGDRGFGGHDPGLEHGVDVAVVLVLLLAVGGEGGLVDVEDDG